MRNKFREIPFYLLLFPAFFILHGYVENPGLVTPASAFGLLAIYAPVAVVIALLFYPVFRNVRKAALMASFILAYQFFFGSLRELLSGFPGAGFLTRFTFLIPAFLAASILVLILLRKRQDVYRMTAYLNLLMLLLVGIELFNLFTGNGDENRKQATTTRERYLPCDSCSSPDIYLFVLDEYAGEEELKQIFNYNNNPFFDTLQRLGFGVFRETGSNYNYTPYSTASMLDMTYLDTMKTRDIKPGYRHALNVINQNELAVFLKMRGYEIVNHSYFPVAGKHPPIKSSLVPTNAQLITDGTFTSRLHEDLLVNLARKHGIDWYLRRTMFATLEENTALMEQTRKAALSRGETPRFIYTHLLMPHFPYYFDKKGNRYTLDELKRINIDDEKAYLSYLEYTNEVILSLINHIDRHSATKPVIALVSDHGFRQSPEASATGLAFSNLLSIRIPGRMPRADTGLTNVNFFRLLLNEQFGQKLPYLENRRHSISF